MSDRPTLRQMLVKYLVGVAKNYAPLLSKADRIAALREAAAAIETEPT